MDRRFFNIGGITINFEADLDLASTSFSPALQKFLVEGPGEDNVTLQRYFKLPDLNSFDLGNKIHNKSPWTIYENRENGHIYYKAMSSKENGSLFWSFADYSLDYSFAKIYSRPLDKQFILRNGWQNLTGYSSDRLWLIQLLPNRSALFMHSSAVILNGKGLLFIGRSKAGKTTTVRMFQEARNKFGTSVDILCDESNILRRWDNNCWHVHGTWSHGEESEVSALSAQLKSIFVIKQDTNNYIIPVSDKSKIIESLLFTLLRPHMTKSWWEKEIVLIDQLIEEIPAYEMHFDRSGKIIPILEDFTLTN